MNEPFKPFSIKSNLGNQEMDIFLSKKQVCKKYGISHMTVESWRKEGLKFYKFGKGKKHMVKYKLKHLEDFMEKHLVV